MPDKVKKFYFPNEEEYNPESEDRYAIPQSPYQANNELRGELDYVRTEGNEDYRDNSVNTLVFNPYAYDDAEEIARQIVGGSSVIVNLEHLIRKEETKLIAQRIVDYLCGVAFAKGITVRKINATTFLIAKE